MKENEMIERYIFEVTRRVPQDMREEIGLELRTLIDDMCTEEECSVEKVLQKLGSPAEFAKRYKDGPDYLIGPEYYDNYIWVVKIALIGIGISAVVSAIVQGIMGAGNYVDFFVGFFDELFATAINGTCSMIGTITIIFAVLEWQKVKVSIKPETKWNVEELTKDIASVKSWSPNLLPPIPNKRAVISRGDSVVSIIFITVFAAILFFAPQLFGTFHYDGNKVESIACVFNLNEWNRIMPIFILSLFVGFIDEIIRLVTGYYCKAVMYSSIICNTIQIIGAVILLKCFQLWNPDFAREIQKMTGVSKFSSGDVLYYWGSGVFNNVILAGICIISCIEVGITVYKTVKYS